MNFLFDFVVLSFASFALWQLVVQAFGPELPDRLSFVFIYITSLIASLLLALPFRFTLLLALAAASGVGLLNAIMKPERLAPLTFSRIKKENQQEQSRKIYVPDL